MVNIVTEHWNEWLKYFPTERFDAYFTEEYTRLYSDDKHNIRLKLQYRF